MKKMIWLVPLGILTHEFVAGLTGLVLAYLP